MIVGITGGTGCGKTTALEAICQLGGLVLDCDAIYHQLLKTDKDLLAAIEDRFPGVVEDGNLQRKKLGSIVFADPQALTDLNQITHKAVKEEVVELLASAPQLVAIDAIGLFEGGLAELCHTTLAITAPEEVRVARLMARDAITQEQALARIRAQKSQDWFVARCDHHLHNEGSMEAFQENCIALYKKIILN